MRTRKNCDHPLAILDEDFQQLVYSIAGWFDVFVFVLCWIERKNGCKNKHYKIGKFRNKNTASFSSNTQKRQVLKIITKNHFFLIFGSSYVTKYEQVLTDFLTETMFFARL